MVNPSFILSIQLTQLVNQDKEISKKVQLPYSITLISAVVKRSSKGKRRIAKNDACNMCYDLKRTNLIRCSLFSYTTLEETLSLENVRQKLYVYALSAEKWKSDEIQ